MIEYRVWDIKENKYLNREGVAINGYGVLIAYGANEDGSHAAQLSNAHSPRFIIEQYTGLKDKNGVEIAVGDILMDDTGELIEYWSVSFSDGSFIGECEGAFESLSELTFLEVIGNIHENAELLEEK